MMGGSVSHEFMLLTDRRRGHALCICRDCGYRANMEAAECIVPTSEPDDGQNR